MLVLTWQGVGGIRGFQGEELHGYGRISESCLFKEKTGPLPIRLILEFSPSHFRGILDLWHPKVSYSYSRELREKKGRVACKGCSSPSPHATPGSYPGVGGWESGERAQGDRTCNPSISIVQGASPARRNPREHRGILRTEWR